MKWSRLRSRYWVENKETKVMEEKVDIKGRGDKDTNKGKGEKG